MFGLKEKEADEATAPFVFLYLAGVVIWIFAALIYIFDVRG